MKRRTFLKAGAAGVLISGIATGGSGAAATVGNGGRDAPSNATAASGSAERRITGVFAVAPSTVCVGEQFFVGVKLLTDLYPVRLSPYIKAYPCITSATSYSMRAPEYPGMGFHYRMDVPEHWDGTLVVGGDHAYDGPGHFRFQPGTGPYPHDLRPIARIGPVRFTSAGVHCITFRDPASGVTAKSNPILVTRKAGDKKLFWGDIHGHTVLTDGVRSPEEYYYFGRDEAFLDVCALTDHVEHYLTSRMWEYQCGVTNDFNAPGRFVTLLGQEWTNTPLGHRNIYHRGASAPFLRSTEPEGFSLHNLYAFARKHNALVVPHHPATARMGCDWSLGHDPEVERLVEIYSTWGSSEHYLGEGHPRRIRGGEVRGQHVVDALNRGYDFGIIASADVHDGRPGHSRNREMDGGQLAGLAGIWARELTRESVFDALWNRSVYATTGYRTILQFEVNGMPMGSSIVHKGALEVKVNAYSEAPIDRAEWVCNGESRRSKSAGSDALEWEFEARPPSDSG